MKLEIWIIMRTHFALNPLHRYGFTKANFRKAKEIRFRAPRPIEWSQIPDIQYSVGNNPGAFDAARRVDSGHAPYSLALMISHFQLCWTGS